MIKVDVITHATNVKEITIHDHANYADEGQDLVCAGVSSIVVGMMNALNEETPQTCGFKMHKGYTNIQVIQTCEQVQLLLKAMLIQLKTMEETYNTYIKINDQEV